jgi:hypothetical protein
MKLSMMKPNILPAVTLALILATVGASAAGKNPSNRAERRPVTFPVLKKEFSNPDMIYAPFMFWFWDEPLNVEKMAEMARVMRSQGFNPGYAHARQSIAGTPSLPDEEWLGDKWFAAFKAALHEAEKRQSYLGYVNEYWWPSFQAHGRVLQQHPELRAESLSWQIIDADGGTEVTVPAAFFAVAAQLDQPGPETAATIRSRTLRLIGAGDAFSWPAPGEERWRIYVFNKFFKPGVDNGHVNCLDDRLAAAFIKIAIEPYAQRMGDKLGKSIPGNFIDHEGDYGWGLAWSTTLDRLFKERYGRDIRLSLPLLVNQDAEGIYAKARWEWFDLVSDLYAANFQAVTDWHAQRGMYTIANLWEESISLQVDAVADHMKLLRAHTMPGTDCLGKKAVRVHDFKEAVSVAEFEKARAMTEMMGAGSFGLAGNDTTKEPPWNNFTPTFLKQAINAVTAWGIGHVVTHGVFTTRKLSTNPWVPDWYADNPMYPYLHLWTDFARRASYLNSQGHAVPDVLLFNPIESGWMNTPADKLDVNVTDNLNGKYDGSRTHVINDVYAGVINDLTDARVEFLVGDRYYMDQMEVQAGRLVRGEFAFPTLVLPSLDILTLATARKMVEFAQAGGRLYALGDLPAASAENGVGDPQMRELINTLRAAPGFVHCPDGGFKALLESAAPGLESPIQFTAGKFKMLQQRRQIDGRDFFWLANNSEQNQQAEVVVCGVKGAAAIWDCETGGNAPVTSVASAAGSKVTLTFKPLEAYWLVFDPQKPAQVIPKKFSVEDVLVVPGLWKVTFDARCQPTMEFPPQPPAEFVAGVEKPLEDWQAWGMAKFSGLLDYTKTIQISKVDQQMFLDLGKVGQVAEVWVNGKSVGKRLWQPYRFEVSKALRPGKNEVRVRVANLINNSYDDIHESGLFGPVTLQRAVPAK